MSTLERHCFGVGHANQTQWVEVVLVLFGELHVFATFEVAVVLLHYNWFAEVDEAASNEQIYDAEIDDMDGVVLEPVQQTLEGDEDLVWLIGLSIQQILKLFINSIQQFLIFLIFDLWRLHRKLEFHMLL